jgi:hypothetical protein
VRAVHALNPPTSEFDYIALVDRLGGAELADAHYRLLSGVGRERATRVWFVRNDPSSLPRALERAVRVELDANDRELAARSIEARREKLEQERRLHFRRALAETIAWCRSGVPPALLPTPLWSSLHHRLISSSTRVPSRRLLTPLPKPLLRAKCVSRTRCPRPNGVFKETTLRAQRSLLAWKQWAEASFGAEGPSSPASFFR